MKRQVGSYLAVQFGAANLAFEHGDFARAVLAEMTVRDFEIRSWRRFICRWRQTSFVDAEICFDSLAGDNLPEDRRTAIDIAFLWADLSDESNSSLRWVPGEQRATDDLTKAAGNGVLFLADPGEVVPRGVGRSPREARQAARGLQDL